MAGYRKPAVGLGQAGNVLDALRDRETQLEAIPFLNGVLLDMSFASGSSFARANHGLGRQYVGAFIIGVTTNFSDTWWEEVCVMTPERATQAGYDPETTVVVRRKYNGGSVGLVDFKLWCF